MTNVQDIIKKCSPWMRISICINIHMKKALINVLHNHIGDPQIQPLPSNPADLYAFLQTNKKTIQKSKFIKEHEKSILLPASSQTVDSSSFDISLTRFLIQTFSGIRNAKGDWREPDTSDQTICGYVYRAASMRNSICHDNNIERLNATEFEKKWKQLKEILQGLKYVEDIEPFKTETLDFERYERVILEEFVDHLRSYRDECSNMPFQDDYILRRFYVDGNRNDIVTESDLEFLVKENDCNIIHGEAGMGKSSTAKRLKNEWCKGKVFSDNNLIYYDSKKINKQLVIQSNAAALVFSELGDHLKKKGRTIDDLSIYNCVKTIIDNLIIVIDGVDEFPVKEFVTGDYVDELERKIINNKGITGTETISAIYFGFLFPYSKVILLGRNGEFESLKKVKVNRDAAIFNRETKDLELLKFDDANIKDFTCLKICKYPSRQTVCTGSCQEIYNRIKNIELCKNPTDLNSLIELQRKHPNENIGKITRTKLIISTIFNRLTNHIKQKSNFTIETFSEISKQNDFRRYISCIRTLGEISFRSLLKNNVTISVKEEQDSNVYFIYQNKIDINREILEELDLFYVRDFDFYYILEPHHTLNIEFLCACYLFSHFEEWDSIFELNEDRRLVIISFIAGLHADDYFTKDFVENVLDTSIYSLEQFFSWLYDVENIRWSLPNGGFLSDYKCWFGLMETQKLSPSFFLLDSISHEVEIPQTFIPKSIVCYCDYSSLSFEWYYMEYLKHGVLTKLSDKLDIELFSKKFPNFKFIIKGDIMINNDKLNRLDQCGANNLVTLRINTLYIETSLNTLFSFYFNVNALLIWDECDSRTIDMILNALLPPPTTTSSSNIHPTLNCKRLSIDDISLFNSQQTEKVFELGLIGVVDYISLVFTFFTDEQIAILEDVELNSHKLINIQLNSVNFNDMFGLPNLGNRHIYLNNVNNVTDSGVNELRNRISPEYRNNFTFYKIITDEVPFVKKENYSRDVEQSMLLNLFNVDFREVSPDVFANTFSMIPSLSCKDNHISSAHWLWLSQTKDCRINEMRIWTPRSKNFKHFVNIKTNTIQFICDSKDDLKELSNYIVNKSNVHMYKEIKVFVVKFDSSNWDYYEEISLLSGKTIEEYRNDYSPDVLFLDNISVPFHEGEQHLKWWCCEISSQDKYNQWVKSFSDNDNFVEEIEEERNESCVIDDTEIEFNRTKKQDDNNSEKNSLCIETSDNDNFVEQIEDNDNFVEEIEEERNESCVIDDTEIENDSTENQDNSNCCFLRRCCCCFYKS